MAKKALYYDCFDPVTLLHVDVMRQAVRIADMLTVAVDRNNPQYDIVELMRAVVVAEIGEPNAMRIEVVRASGDGLTGAIGQAKPDILICPVRDQADFNQAQRQATLVEAIFSNVQPVLIPAAAPVRHISAGLVRQIIGMGGDVSAFVPAAVMDYLRQN